MRPCQLIIDSGSTKMEWVLLEPSGKTQTFITEGFNPNYSHPDKLNALIEEIFPSVSAPSNFSIHYYGSGCGTEKNRKIVKEMFQTKFPEAQVEVTHDLMAAVHATLGYRPGIACILGTGANACLYDGKEIVAKPVSLGYLVGDEGSGCYIGRKLIRAYFYHLMPDDLAQQFEAFYHPDVSDFIERVYHNPEASKYLADFTHFAGEHKEHPFIQSLVRQCFSDFKDVFIEPFPNSHHLPVTFVGSIAYHFQDILIPFLKEEGFLPDIIMQKPMDGLIEFYKNIDVNSAGDNH